MKIFKAPLNLNRNRDTEGAQEVTSIDHTHMHRHIYTDTLVHTMVIQLFSMVHGHKFCLSSLIIDRHTDRQMN